jgi:hypothetical protein
MSLCLVTPSVDDPRGVALGLIARLRHRPFTVYLTESPSCTARLLPAVPVSAVAESLLSLLTSLVTSSSRPFLSFLFPFHDTDHHSVPGSSLEAFCKEKVEGAVEGARGGWAGDGGSEGRAAEPGDVDAVLFAFLEHLESRHPGLGPLGQQSMAYMERFRALGIPHRLTPLRVVERLDDEISTVAPSVRAKWQALKTTMNSDKPGWYLAAFAMALLYLVTGFPSEDALDFEDED